jgi:hypothetical protein
LKSVPVDVFAIKRRRRGSAEEEEEEEEIIHPVRSLRRRVDEAREQGTASTSTPTDGTSSSSAEQTSSTSSSSSSLPGVQACEVGVGSTVPPYVYPDSTVAVTKRCQRCRKERGEIPSTTAPHVRAPGT